MVESTGLVSRSTSMPKNETSQPIEALLSIQRGGGHRLGAQIEAQLRDQIRNGQLRPATPVPSTRDLARQLDVSRRIVVDAYAQLAAEGYLTLRQGARPCVNTALPPVTAPDAAGAAPAAARRPRYDFQPSAPDVAPFPRAAWLRSLRAAVSEMTDAELGYGDPAVCPCCARRSPTTSAASAASSPIRPASSSPAATRRASASSAACSPTAAPAGSRSRTRATPSTT